jgi:DNA-binding transcriptional LysR family regulator
LLQADLPFDVIYTSHSFSSIRAAWTSGFGITALPARAIDDASMIIAPHSGLPPLPDLNAGIYLAGQMSSPDAGPFALRFAELLSQSYRCVA